jgi:hypothetical protein
VRRLLAVVVLCVLLVTIALSYVVSGGAEGRPADVLDQIGPKLTRKTAVPDAIRRVAGSQPLNADVYFVAALQDENAHADRGVEALVRAAVRRDPRLPEARLWMAQHYLSSGQVNSGVAEFGVLARLGEQGDSIATILGVGSVDPAVRRAVQHSFVGTADLINIAATGVSHGVAPAAILEILRGTDLAKLQGGARAVQVRLAGSYLERSDFRDAYVIWRSLLPKPPAGPVYDGDFEGLAGGPPFGWTLNVNPDVEARVTGNLPSPYRSALQARAFAALPAEAASQQLLLGVGARKLSFLARSDSPEEGAASATWRLNCASGAWIAELRFTAAARWTRYSLPFTVPGNCQPEKLQLITAGAPTGSSPSLLVTAVSIAP